MLLQPWCLDLCHVNTLCSYSTGYEKIHLKMNRHYFANDSATIFLGPRIVQAGNAAWRPARDRRSGLETPDDGKHFLEKDI